MGRPHSGMLAILHLSIAHIQRSGLVKRSGIQAVLLGFRSAFGKHLALAPCLVHWPFVLGRMCNPLVQPRDGALHKGRTYSHAPISSFQRQDGESRKGSGRYRQWCKLRSRWLGYDQNVSVVLSSGSLCCAALSSSLLK